MNYTEYNNQLKLPDDLYKKTLAGVKSEISKQNQIQRKKKVASLSFAACFMILVTSISTVKYLNHNSSDAIETTHHSSTNNKGFSTDNRTIKIKIEDTKYPQKIIIDNNRVGVGHVDSRFDDGGRYQYIIVVICKIDNCLFEFFGFHLSVTYDCSGVRNKAMYEIFQFIKLFYSVIDDKYLAVSTHFEIDGFFDNIFIKSVNLGLYRVSVRGGSRYGRKIPSTH